MLFYLGVHRPGWLSKAGVPLFVSHTTLRERRRPPRAVERWALDSGGFTELSRHGRWTTSPAEYARAIQRYAAEIGRLDWAAPQDWMCEPSIREMTGRSIEYHQCATTASVLELRDLVPDTQVIPVLQGWELADYLEHVDRYERAGVTLRDEPVVGVGTVCRRQSGREGAQIVAALARLGLRLHGFGFKTTGLARVGGMMASADSMAWSYHARRRPALAGHGHKNCANCLDYALQWRTRLLGRSQQLELFALEASDAPSETEKRSAKGAAWEWRGYRAEHCGHPTALYPWALTAPDGRLVLSADGHAWASKNMAKLAAQLHDNGEDAVLVDSRYGPAWMLVNTCSRGQTKNQGDDHEHGQTC